MKRALLLLVFLLPPPQLTGQAYGQTPADGSPPPVSPEQRLADLESRPLQSFTNVDLADYLKLRADAIRASGAPYDPADNVRHFALKAVGQSFRLNAARFDLSESDCVVFVERCLAMALARDWESYRLLCDRLRHKDGQVDFKNRNFSTLGDWLPNNQSWLLNDVTSSLVPGEDNPAETFTHIVRPKVFEDRPAAPDSKFTKTTFKGSDYNSELQETRMDSFIPWKAIPQVLSQLRTGDIALTLNHASGGHLGCDHMGIIIQEDDGTITLVHSVPPRVRRDLLAEFAGRSTRCSGFKFLRLRSDARHRVIEEATRVAPSFTVPDAKFEDSRTAKVILNRMMQQPPAPKPALKHAYQVRPGDTWWALANEWLGDETRWQELRDLNASSGTAVGGRLRVGSTIELEP